MAKEREENRIRCNQSEMTGWVQGMQTAWLRSVKVSQLLDSSWLSRGSPVSLASSTTPVWGVISVHLLSCNPSRSVGLFRSLRMTSRRLPVTRTEPVPFLKQMSNRCAYGWCLGVCGFPLQVQRKVLGAARQQTVWTVAPVTRAE